MRTQAKRAATAVEAKLVSDHCAPKVSDSFAVSIAGEEVRIPERLYFPQGYQSIMAPDDPAWLGEQALQTRSLDGYQRQRAVRHLLGSIEPWNAPFIVALIGSYVIEILYDIESGLSDETYEILREFQGENPEFWNLTKSRVVSYWNVYQRELHVGPRRKLSARDNVGRSRIDAMEQRP